MIQDKLCQQIANKIFELVKYYKIEPYNEKNNSGIIRHLLIRIGKKTNQVMVTIVTNQKSIPYEDLLVSSITNEFKEIRTITKNINCKNTNVILGNQTEVLYGDGIIEDYLGKYKFELSTESFYQVNPVQTEILYNQALEYANLTGIENIFDLYCGIGTIGIFASSRAKSVYGIEVVPQAIENAKRNATINNINNIQFMVGEVERILPELVKNYSADVVFIDPPRKGCEKNVLETLLKIQPKKIVYISCNPATLARDAKVLTEKYSIMKVQPVDMFPWTTHVECVSVLELKESIEK